MSAPVHPFHQFWFHCGRCGALFQSRAGDLKERVCAHCGGNPSLGLLDPMTDAAASSDTPAGDAATRSVARSVRVGRKRKHRHITLKLGAAWLLTISLIVIGARRRWHVDQSTQKPVTAAAATSVESAEDRLFISNAVPKCADALFAFLAAGIPEVRNQFVLTPIETAARMARFYTMNPWMRLDPASLKLIGSSVLCLPSGKAIETHWQAKGGKIIDAVFCEDQGEWRLDWDHFARYSDYPWSLFLAGSGPSEGEFRLLARERLAIERKDDETISLVLYAPRFGQPGDAGYQSPRFLIPRKSRDGRLLEAAFELARKKHGLFGTTLPDIDPETMIRVRVKIRRTEVNMERKFDITGVIACHWYSVDDPGLTPAPAESRDPKLENGTANERQ